MASPKRGSVHSNRFVDVIDPHLRRIRAEHSLEGLPPPKDKSGELLKKARGKRSLFQRTWLKRLIVLSNRDQTLAYIDTATTDTKEKGVQSEVKGVLSVKYGAVRTVHPPEDGQPYAFEVIGQEVDDEATEARITISAKTEAEREDWMFAILLVTWSPEIYRIIHAPKVKVEAKPASPGKNAQERLEAQRLRLEWQVEDAKAQEKREQESLPKMEDHSEEAMKVLGKALAVASAQKLGLAEDEMGAIDVQTNLRTILGANAPTVKVDLPPPPTTATYRLVSTTVGSDGQPESPPVVVATTAPRPLVVAPPTRPTRGTSRSVSSVGSTSGSEDEGAGSEDALGSGIKQRATGPLRRGQGPGKKETKVRGTEDSAHGKKPRQVKGTDEGEEEDFADEGDEGGSEGESGEGEGGLEAEADRPRNFSKGASARDLHRSVGFAASTQVKALVKSPSQRVHLGDSQDISMSAATATSQAFQGPPVPANPAVARPPGPRPPPARPPPAPPSSSSSSSSQPVPPTSPPKPTQQARPQGMVGKFFSSMSSPKGGKKASAEEDSVLLGDTFHDAVDLNDAVNVENPVMLAIAEEEAAKAQAAPAPPRPPPRPLGPPSARPPPPRATPAPGPTGTAPPRATPAPRGPPVSPGGGLGAGAPPPRPPPPRAPPRPRGPVPSTVPLPSDPARAPPSATVVVTTASSTQAEVASPQRAVQVQIVSPAPAPTSQKPPSPPAKQQQEESPMHDLEWEMAEDDGTPGSGSSEPSSAPTSSRPVSMAGRGLMGPRGMGGRGRGGRGGGASLPLSPGGRPATEITVAAMLDAKRATSGEAAAEELAARKAERDALDTEAEAEAKKAAGEGRLKAAASKVSATVKLSRTKKGDTGPEGGEERRSSEEAGKQRQPDTDTPARAAEQGEGKPKEGGKSTKIHELRGAASAPTISPSVPSTACVEDAKPPSPGAVTSEPELEPSIAQSDRVAFIISQLKTSSGSAAPSTSTEEVSSPARSPAAVAPPPGLVGKLGGSPPAPPPGLTVMPSTPLAPPPSLLASKPLVGLPGQPSVALPPSVPLPSSSLPVPSSLPLPSSSLPVPSSVPLPSSSLPPPTSVVPSSPLPSQPLPSQLPPSLPLQSAPLPSSALPARPLPMPSTTLPPPAVGASTLPSRSLPLPSATPSLPLPGSGPPAPTPLPPPSVSSSTPPPPPSLTASSPAPVTPPSPSLTPSKPLPSQSLPLPTASTPLPRPVLNMPPPPTLTQLPPPSLGLPLPPPSMSVGPPPSLGLPPSAASSAALKPPPSLALSPALMAGPPPTPASKASTSSTSPPPDAS